MILYLTSCGCKVPISGIKKLSRKVDGKWTQRLRCITCGKEGIILSRQNTCLDCGKTFEKPAAVSRIGEICDICSYDRTKTRSRAQRVEIRRDEVIAKNKTNPLYVDIKGHITRGDYCISGVRCRKDGWPKCLDCDDFLPIFKGVDPGRMEQ